MSSKTIGLVGVGLLGTALARRLLETGFQVVGFDLDDARTDGLERAGGQAAGSLDEVANSCSRLIFSLPDSRTVAEVTNELLESLDEGAMILDTTTGDPEASKSLAERLALWGVTYLDATVAGSSQQAQQGDVVLMVGGSKVAFDHCHDVFSSLARQTFHIGPAGAGSRMKLVVNLVLGLNRAVLAEGLSLAHACGIDVNTTLDVLRSGAAYSAAMDSKGAKMVQRDFTPQARLSQHRKDVGLILTLAQSHQTELPLSRLHAELLDRAIQLGFGDLDNSAILKVFD